MAAGPLRMTTKSGKEQHTQRVKKKWREKVYMYVHIWGENETNAPSRKLKLQLPAILINYLLQYIINVLTRN